MGFRDRVYDLQTPDEVDEFIEQYPISVLFKAGGCHKTMQAFTCVEEVLDPYEDLCMGFIRVIEFRPASNRVTEVSGIQHESPQFLLLHERKVVVDLDNWDITQAALQDGVEPFLGVPKGASSCQNVSSDLTQYLRLLERYVREEISEGEFSIQWLKLFQGDATPRSKSEFEALNSLFGDVDYALSVEGASTTADLRPRAAELLQKLA